METLAEMRCEWYKRIEASWSTRNRNQLIIIFISIKRAAGLTLLPFLTKPRRNFEPTEKFVPRTFLSVWNHGATTELRILEEKIILFPLSSKHRYLQTAQSLNWDLIYGLNFLWDWIWDLNFKNEDWIHVTASSGLPYIGQASGCKTRTCKSSSHFDIASHSPFQSETEISLIICRELHTCANCTLVLNPPFSVPSPNQNWTTPPLWIGWHRGEKRWRRREASTAPDMAPGWTSNCVLSLLCGSLLLVTAGKFAFDLCFFDKKSVWENVTWAFPAPSFVHALRCSCNGWISLIISGMLILTKLMHVFWYF